MNDVEKILDLTPRQYFSLMKGQSLQTIDKRYDQHLSAWLTQSVQATSKDGKKSAYKKFEDFFDYDKALRKMDQQIKPKKMPQTKVEKFNRSVKEAERLLNEGR